MDSYQAGDPVGKGDTEKAAVADLLVQVDLKDYKALGLLEAPLEAAASKSLS